MEMIAFWRENRYDIVIWGGLVCLCMLFLSSPRQAAAGKDQLQQRIREAQGKLKAIEQRIKESERRIKKMQAAEEELLRKIEICDQSIDRYKYKRAILDDKINSIKLKQKSLDLEIAKGQDGAARQKNLLARRLRALYKAGPLRFWRLILEARSAAEVSQRVNFMKLIAEQDAKLIESFSRQIGELRAKKEQISRYQQEIEELQKSVTEEERAWIQKKTEKENYLKALRDEKNKYCRAHEGLSSRLSELQALLTDLEKKRRLQPAPPLPSSPEFSAKTGFAARRGKLCWPAEGKIISTSPFGKQSAGLETNAAWNKGISIKAPAGSEIRSIYSGRVAYADWCLGYGKLLIVDHGEGYCSIYAHASEFLVEAGDLVKERQPIARVGDTGGVSEPQVYFEIRFRGNPLDPLKWLQ